MRHLVGNASIGMRSVYNDILIPSRLFPFFNGSELCSNQLDSISEMRHLGNRVGGSAVMKGRSYSGTLLYQCLDNVGSDEAATSCYENVLVFPKIHYCSNPQEFVGRTCPANSLPWTSLGLGGATRPMSIPAAHAKYSTPLIVPIPANCIGK